jgi:hypothetical protein
LVQGVAADLTIDDLTVGDLTIVDLTFHDFLAQACQHNADAFGHGWVAVPFDQRLQIRPTEELVCRRKLLEERGFVGDGHWRRTLGDYFADDYFMDTAARARAPRRTNRYSVCR